MSLPQFFYAKMLEWIFYNVERKLFYYKQLGEAGLLLFTTVELYRVEKFQKLIEENL